MASWIARRSDSGNIGNEFAETQKKGKHIDH
jgi:hypothetical protein